MNWDDLSEEAAQPFGECRSHDMRFVNGANWQRDQLRTDEAVERVAESMWTTDPAPALEPFDGPETWAEQDEEMKGDYRKAARHAITALLGEDT